MKLFLTKQNVYLALFESNKIRAVKINLGN